MTILTNRPIERCCFSHILTFAFVLLLCGQVAHSTSDSYPLKPPDTSSPRATMEVFMNYMSRAYQAGLVKGSKDEAVIVLLNRARAIFFIASGWTIVTIGNGFAELIITSKRLFVRNIDANLIRLISRLVTLVLVCVLLWNTSDYLGMSLHAIFASAGIVGLGVALAARETLANFFGGVSIFLDRPFKSGDYIVLDSGERGQVVDVGLRSTRMLTRDDVQISIPNSLMTNTKIINESAPRPQFRVRIKVGVAYGTDLNRVEEILLSMARQNNMVAVVPEPRVRFRNFGDSSLEFELLCWARRPEDRGRLIHGLNHQIYKAFDAADIQIPFPQRDIHMNTHTDHSE